MRKMTIDTIYVCPNPDCGKGFVIDDPGWQCGYCGTELVRKEDPRDNKMQRHIKESNLIEGFNSKEADECLLRAWEYLLKQDKLTKQVVCHVQKMSTFHQKGLKSDWRGAYRTIPVYIGNHEGLEPNKIPVAMKNLLSIADITNPKEWHIEFEKIHPFVDGNGRTGRLLMWWQEIKRDEEPTLITYAERKDYYKWFMSEVDILEDYLRFNKFLNEDQATSTD